jgi:glucose/arabinose dehydrogenase
VNEEPYAIPADNPFVGQIGVRGEIWAFGLRNPWRFSFDKLTGDLFIADVGQNEWEEISWQPAGIGGQNYGWRIYEGSQCYLDNCNTPNLTPPIGEYSHSGGHCSVTGGYMYRGTAVPALWGNYFLADYWSGAVWRLFPNPSTGAWDLAEVGRFAGTIASFGEDVNGELYLLSQNEGVVYRVRQ